MSSMTEREKKMKEHIEYLLDYARRIAQRQITLNDPAKLMEIRLFLKELKQEQ